MPSGHGEGSNLTTNVEIKQMSTMQVLYQTRKLILNFLFNNKINAKSLLVQCHTATKVLTHAGKYLKPAGEHH